MDTLSIIFGKLDLTDAKRFRLVSRKYYNASKINPQNYIRFRKMVTSMEMVKGNAFKFATIHTYEICLKAVNKRYPNIVYIKDEDMIIALLKMNIDLFEYIEKKYVTHRIQTYVISRRPRYIDYIENPSDDIICLAITKNIIHIQKYLDKEHIVDYAIKINYEVLFHNIKLFTLEQLYEIINSFYQHTKLDDILYEEKLQKVLNRIKNSYPIDTYNTIVQYIFKFDQRNIKYIVKINYDLTRSAISQNGLLIKEIPEGDRTSELCILAVKQNGLALQYIPKILITDEMCIDALRNNINTLRYVPEYTEVILNFIRRGV